MSFELVADLDFESALIRRDLGRDYGEARFNALGYIGDTLFYITLTPRGERMRVINFRRANSREAKRYAET
ncbi:MAG: BrnT family toxin [Thermodesulfobacteriota bacterium]|nr:BrnT family toxin [Thermodesulfobacteriota bacterium]